MNIKKQSKEINEILERVSYEVLLLHEKREIFRELYDSGVDVIKLLNFGAARFFAIHKNMLVDDILLSMRRLIDRKEATIKGVTRKNLSLDYLISHIVDPEKKTEVEELLVDAKGKADFALVISNKRIAHNDDLTKQKLEKLPDFDLETIDEALLAFAKVMNCLRNYLGFSEFVYPIAGISTGKDLVFRIRQAKDHCDSLQEWLRRHDKKRDQ